MAGLPGIFIHLIQRNILSIILTAGILLNNLLFPSRIIAREHNSPVISRSSVDTLSHHDLKRGERLFYGLLPLGKNTFSCVSCHVAHPPDTFNWNPSAYEIALAAAAMEPAVFRNKLVAPSGKGIGPAHTGYAELSEEDAGLIRAFLVHLGQQEPAVHKPVMDRLLIFIGLIVLLFFAFLDLVWFKVIPYRAVHLIFIMAATVLIVRTLVIESISLGRSQHFEPDQPIKFSHRIHAGENKIDCQYCHSTAEYSKSAGIPSASLCLNCHMIIRDATHSGKFEINKIFASVENKKPIPWVKVYNLPDHAFFSHAQHVGAGKIDCRVCHGPVETKDRVAQVPDLSMGWCVNCHRDTTLHGVNGKRAQASTDCVTCHY
jgi:hypothetical protein